MIYLRVEEDWHKKRAKVRGQILFLEGFFLSNQVLSLNSVEKYYKYVQICALLVYVCTYTGWAEANFLWGGYSK